VEKMKELEEEQKKMARRLEELINEPDIDD